MTLEESNHTQDKTFRMSLGKKIKIREGRNFYKAPSRMPKKILEKLFGIFTRGQKDMSM
jgi:hypothetical protein